MGPVAIQFTIFTTPRTGSVLTASSVILDVKWAPHLPSSLEQDFKHTHLGVIVKLGITRDLGGPQSRASA